jgi:RimJ/RimL family protein N-acetyltransferase
MARDREPGWSDVAALGLRTERLLLSPLTSDDAEAMAEVLADTRLHEFTGGEPATLEELRARYHRWAAGSSKVDEVWLNWIVRRLADDRAVGTVQATLVRHGGEWSAQVAWVVGLEWQRQGFASEAGRALVDWLLERGAVRVTANIHPDHSASATVASRAGLRPTSDEVEGERVWRVDSSLAP